MQKVILVGCILIISSCFNDRTIVDRGDATTDAKTQDIDKSDMSTDADKIDLGDDATSGRPRRHNCTGRDGDFS